jgi:flagellar biosynthesis/type III secretory pathway protein FliH
MSSSAKPRRVIRGSQEQADVFVLGQSPGRPRLAPPAILADADQIRASAHDEAADIIAIARAEAATIVATAREQAADVRDAAFAEGVVEGRAESERELAAYVDAARTAANEGKAIRDEVAGQAAAVVSHAVMLATRRIVGEYYEAGPERTAAIVADALRAASGQQIVSIRLHPDVAGRVEVSLPDAARYIVPDEGVAVGGCIVDLAHGRIDATLDTRLSLMELALKHAGGEVER